MTYVSEIQRYLIKIGVNVADAQDIMQDVLVKLLQADLVLNPDKLRPWLYRVALNRFYDLYRRKKRYQTLLVERFHLFEGNGVQVSCEDRILRLELALPTLTDYQLSLITLYYEDEKSIEEISRIYQISEAKVKTDLYRTRQKLKKEMENYHEN
jgi:RNA polymerase sigma-70 factor (ECF subfamily)